MHDYGMAVIISAYGIENHPPEQLAPGHYISAKPIYPVISHLRARAVPATPARQRESNAAVQSDLSKITGLSIAFHQASGI